MEEGEEKKARGGERGREGGRGGGRGRKGGNCEAPARDGGHEVEEEKKEEEEPQENSKVMHLGRFRQMAFGKDARRYCSVKLGIKKLVTVTVPRDFVLHFGSRETTVTINILVLSI